MKYKKIKLVSIIGILILNFTCSCLAETVHVAVAANFTNAAKDIAKAFREKTGHEVILSFGASGLLYTQIKEGAPFHVFLSADKEFTQKLVEDNFGVATSRFTYAIGTLVLWSKKSDIILNEQVLKNGQFSRISIANPAIAPYGSAAIEVMTALKVYDSLKSRLVRGNSISQAFQFIDTGNAEIGFVALSQIIDRKDGIFWQIPQNLYTQIRQEAILLKSAEQNSAAKEFLVFLNGSAAHDLIRKYGYGIFTQQ